MALHHLGVVHSDLFKFDESLAYFMRALKLRRSLGDSAERDTASTLNNMAAVLHQLGRNEQCLAVYGKSLEIKKKLLAPTHPSIADTLYNMGALNLELNRPGPASEYFVMALTISTTKLGMNHPLTFDLQKQILTCDTLATQQAEREAAHGSDHGGSGGGHGAPASGHGPAGPPPPGQATNTPLQAAADSAAAAHYGALDEGVHGADLASRLRLDKGLFADSYSRDRGGSGDGGSGSQSTVMFPPNMTPPSGSTTPVSGSNTPRVDAQGRPVASGQPGFKRSLTGNALSILATPPMSPLTRFD
jgi:hypothetical protein